MKIVKSIVLTALLSSICLSLQAQDKEFTLDETYSIQEGGTIYLSSDDAEVTITGSDRDDVHVVIYRSIEVDGLRVNSSGEFSVNVENQGGDLYITEHNTEEFSVMLGDIDEEYRITIEAPANVALEISGDDDSYEISNINSAIALSADDTEVEISNTESESFNFNMDDGNIRMEQGQGELNLNMDDGKLFVERAGFNEIDIEADDGEIEIATSLADDGLYLFEMDDGELELTVIDGGGTFEIDHDDTNIEVGEAFEEVRVDESESVYRLPGGSARIEIDTDDGQVELETD